VFAGEPRWSPPLRSYETWLVSRRHPYRRSTGADLERWIVRGVGRIATHHVDGDEVAWFGGLECADDAEVVAALVAAAASWAAERGARVLRGPALYLPDDGDAGVLVDGFDHAGGTARPWHPPWYAAHLATAGLAAWGVPMPRWRLPTNRAQNSGPRAEARPTDGEVRAARGSARGSLPPHAGRLGDPALVLPGVAAVPDVTAVARGRRRRATEASVVLLDGDPAALVPRLLAAATAYDALWAPWSPDPGRRPDTVHRLYEMVADRNRLP
jgi:hypothetical protein